MPTNELPEKLKPYNALGMELNWSEGKRNAGAICPFCGREGKFDIKVETGQYNCFSCGTSGETYGFIAHHWKESDAGTIDYKELQEEKGLLYADTLMHWGAIRSTYSDRWLVPGYNLKGEVQQLYRYITIANKSRLLPLPTIGHKLHGINLYDKEKLEVFLCEGFWDAVALWEVLGAVKMGEGGLIARTSNKKLSLLSSINVLAVPSCMVFFDQWAPLFSGKIVNICFDNDHPRKHPKTGATVAPSAYTGLQRVVSILASAKEPPAEINFLRWGENGYDEKLPHGTDIRDLLGGPRENLDGRIEGLRDILDRMEPIPEGWVIEGARKPTIAGKGLTLFPCESYRELVMSWRKALKWTDGLDRALSVMLAAVTSTKIVGDQLWVKIIGPASCGKSTLCEAISVNTNHIIAKSTIRGFHSGYKTDREGQEDNSLVAIVGGKTLVTKDGDTLLQSPNLGQILAEARDLYDCTSRTHYRNKMSKDYEGIRMTWILCGTSSLRSIDSSELGERFLDCVIMDTIEEELEDAILWRVANRTERNMSAEANGKPESQREVELSHAMALTGGYIDYLREDTGSLLLRVQTSKSRLKQCVDLGKFVAYMRARPSTQQDESAEREFAARLVSQLTRLAKCLAVVLNREEVDGEVMRRVKQVALDTSRGPTLEMLEELYKAKSLGLTHAALAVLCNRQREKIQTFLYFLKGIGAVTSYAPKGTQKHWRLSSTLQKLYERVKGI